MGDIDPETRPWPASDAYFDLGQYTRTVTSSSSDAQVWFNRGLIWSYAFNHEEAAQCFGQAIAHDPKCSMAYWGLAYTLGPNYNKPWEVFDGRDLGITLRQTHLAALAAKNNISNATSEERALIEAVRYRYPSVDLTADYSHRNREYAAAMKKVYEAFPHDLDVAALYADSLMNLTPWQLWDIKTGQPNPNAYTLEVKAILDRALAGDGGLNHPGLLHLYIHLQEMSPNPEAALTAADRLRGLVPDAGHLQHMPSHLDVLCGDYRRAIASNSDAIRADDRFFSCTSPRKFYTLYRCHDYHFKVYAAMLAGQCEVALETVRQLEAAVTEELLRIKSPPLADWLEGFLAMRIHALIRFGRWEDIIQLNLPRDVNLYCSTTAMIHYGRGVALAATGRIIEADAERGLFAKAVKVVPQSRTIFNNTCQDILRVAEAMLDGEIEYRRGNLEVAFEHLRQAIARDDSLPYDEPWGWMQPTRHAFGALLLEQGKIEAAAAVYRADLGFDDTLPRALQHPNNVWSLHGYHECLVRLGRMAEASVLRMQLKLATAVADVPIRSSCFCRIRVEE